MPLQRTTALAWHGPQILQTVERNAFFAERPVNNNNSAESTASAVSLHVMARPEPMSAPTASKPAPEQRAWPPPPPPLPREHDTLARLTRQIALLCDAVSELKGETKQLRCQMAQLSSCENIKVDDLERPHKTHVTETTADDLPTQRSTLSVSANKSLRPPPAQQQLTLAELIEHTSRRAQISGPPYQDILEKLDEHDELVLHRKQLTLHLQAGVQAEAAACDRIHAELTAIREHQYHLYQIKCSLESHLRTAAQDSRTKKHPQYSGCNTSLYPTRRPRASRQSGIHRT